jgi:hypothetical protein
MLIITATRTKKKPPRLWLKMLLKVMPGISLVYSEPYQIDLSIAGPEHPFFIAGDVIEPNMRGLKREIHITINPDQEKKP